jgi:zinc protease
MSRKLFRSTVLAAAIAASLLAPSLSCAAIDLAAPIPVGPQVKVGKLPNGLTYYIQKNGRPAHRLELRLVVKAGSVLEDEDQQGLAHFAEHMAFNGTTHFRKHELVSYLQSIGVKFGADLNAYTAFDETVYMLPVPTQDRAHVEQAFTVLEDWAHGVSFEEADIDKERAIVLEEARTRKGADERVRKVLMPRLFKGTRYADRDPIGKEDVLRSFRPDTLRQFYRDWYRPDLMAVVAVGDCDAAEVERQIVAHFSALRNPEHARVRSWDDIKPLAGTEALIVTDREIPISGVGLNYPVHAGPRYGTYGDYRNRKVERLFGVMMGARLAELSQQLDPPFMSAASGLTQPTPRHQGYFAGASLGAGGSAPAIAALLHEHRRVREFGFSADELARARKIMLKGIERSYTERDTTNSAVYVNEYLRHFLNGEEIPGIAAEFQLLQELLPGIGLDEINAYARRTIPGDSDKLVIYTGGKRDGEAVPTGAQLLAEVASAERGKVAVREVKAVAARLMERPAVSGSIVAESEDKALGLTRLTFSNGIKVLLKPTTFHKDQVLLKAERFGGRNLFDEKDLINVRYADSLLGAMGLKDFSPVDLGKVLAGRDAGLGMDFYGATDAITGNAGSSLEDIEVLLQFLWLRFDGVRRDEDLYKSYRAKQEEFLRHRDAMPEARFGDAVTDTLYGKHPYEPRAIVLADLDRLDLDRSIALYRQRFASAKGFTFVIAGSFDVARIKPLLAAYLGTLPTADLPLAYRDVGLRFAKGVLTREVKAGTEPKSVVSLHFTGPAAWSPEEQLRMDAMVEVMNLRIVDVLREKLGLIYGGQMGGMIDRIPYQQYWVGVDLPTGPEKVDATVAALFGEIDRLKQQGPDPADLEKVKSHWRQSWPQRLQTNGYWLDLLNEAELYGIDPQRLLLRQERADAITAEDIRQAARRYFDTGNYAQVVMNPETGAPAGTTAAKPTMALTPR